MRIRNKLSSILIIFMGCFSLAFAATPPNDSQQIGTHVFSPTPHQKSYILGTVPYQQISFSTTDHPACRDGTSPGDMQSFTWSGTQCPTGYVARIVGSLVRAGGNDGQDTGNDINGFGLAQLNVSPDPAGYMVSYCAFTFYGSGEGNASRAWLTYTIYCDSNSK